MVAQSILVLQHLVVPRLGFILSYSHVSKCSGSLHILVVFLTPDQLPSLEQVYQRSLMITQEMCPIRAEFSTHKHLGKCIYLLFEWLAVIGFRQNYFYISPNFGDFGAKMSFFHYIINQKRNNFIEHCSPPVYQEAADIRDVYLYKKFEKALALQVGSWYTGGRYFIDKKSKGCRLTAHKMHYSQWKNSSFVHFLLKAWNLAEW